MAEVADRVGKECWTVSKLLARGRRWVLKLKLNEPALILGDLNVCRGEDGWEEVELRRRDC